MAKKPSALNKVIDTYSESITNVPTTEAPAPTVTPSAPKRERPKKKKEEKYNEAFSPLGKLTGGGYTPPSTPFSDPLTEKENNEKQIEDKKRKVPFFKHSAPDTNASMPNVAEDRREDAAPDEPDSIDHEQLEYEIDLEDQLAARKERRVAARREKIDRIKTIAMTLACVYLLFLTYGALNTSYAYDDNGRIYAQKLTVEQIQALNDFEVIANEYRQARSVYEAALRLDYRIAAGIEDPLLIAPEYEKLLEQIDALAIQCQALTVPTRYTQLQSMLNIWITTDIAVYCQNMSAAISRDDAVKAQKALEYRTTAYNDFSVITANIATMGATVDGADITDITEWSPEKYINQQIGDIGGNLS